MYLYVKLNWDAIFFFPVESKNYEFRFVWREKEGDLTQSYDKNPYTNRKFENQRTTHTTPPKTSITQQLRTDLGRSVGVTSNPTGVVKPVYGIPTFPLTAKAV